MFKKFVSVLMLLVMAITLSGCGDTKTIVTPVSYEKGVVQQVPITYDTYGLFNKEDKRNPNVEYRIIIGNIVWSVILVETIIAPFYFWGFSMWEPVGLKHPNAVKGQIGR